MQFVWQYGQEQMTLGNKYLFLSTGQRKVAKEIAKFIHIKLLIISVTIQIEPTYILLTITLFNKATLNLTLEIEE